MPLPASWRGCFYSEETGGGLIFDLGAVGFIKKVGSWGSGADLIARACFDLILNGHKDLANEMLIRAKEFWQEAPWDEIPPMVERFRPLLHDMDPEVRIIIGNSISRLFGGIVTYQLG